MERIATPACPFRAACWLLLIGMVWQAAVRADEQVFHAGFDDPQASWVIVPRPSGPTVQQQRVGKGWHSAPAAEQFVFMSQQPIDKVEVTHDLPPSLVFSDLTGALWVKASRTGVRVGLHVRFPNQIDPRTGKPVQEILLGDSYTTPGEWQQLTCRTTDDAVDELVRRLRNLLRQQSDPVQFDQRTAIVERMVVQLELPAGRTDLVLDDLDFGPIVPPAAAKVDPLRQRRQPLQRQVRATIGDDQLLIDGRPSIVVFAPYHGEEVDELARMRLNVVWIDRYDDAPLLGALDAVGLFAMANPLSREVPLDAELQPEIDLVSFTEETSPILFWNMGTRLKRDSLPTQSRLMAKVRAADAVRARPIFVDVVGDERPFHRHADMLGSSRHILHTSTAPRDYYEFLRRKKMLALPDKPMFTLIQTETADANLVSRTDGQTLPIVEPEQIWMQGYAALQAGYKGIGFWKLTSLTEPTLGNAERRRAISLFNAHIQLLEPLLASAKFMQLAPATVTSSRQSSDGGGRNRFGRNDKQDSGGRSRPDDREQKHAPVQVAVFNCDHGMLLLPLWSEDNAQFQPGPMSADELSFVVVAPENVQAWEVTTTSVTPLPNKLVRQSGGMQIRLSTFDQFTAIVLTQGEAPIRELKQRLQALQADCAREWIDLAVAKTARVTDVHGKLAPVAPSIAHADSMLSTARQLVDKAEEDLASGDFDGARQKSRVALRLTRIVQRQHWENAVRSAKLTSGVSSPHTICFQTLPEHWQLLATIGKGSDGDDNLLRSGGFEDSNTFFAHGWDHEQGGDPRVRPRAELFGIGAAEGTYSLRLQAQPVDPSRPLDDVAEAPERIVSPPLPVYAGQIVHISGKVQVLTPLTGHPDGLVIYESTKGTVGALRWRDPTPPKQWQPFQLIREIHNSQDLTITIELRGLGDVRIDDLKVVAIESD